MIRSLTAFTFLALSFLTFTSTSRAATYAYDDTVAYLWQSSSPTNVAWDGTCTSYPTDDDKQLVNIGFTFNFADIDYTQVRILSNGALHFGADQGFQMDYSNEAMPITTAGAGPCAASAADRVIAPYWEDLNPSSGGQITYETIGSAPNRQFVASWVDVARYGSGGSYTFQVILYETSNEIKFQYGAGNANGTSATIGVEVDDTDFTEYSYNTNSVANGDAILFYRDLHFAITHDGVGDPCQPEPVTITRHDPIHVIDTTYTGTINLTTSTNHGDWSVITANGTLINSGNGVATYTYTATDNGQVILGLRNTFNETLNIDITDGSAEESTLEDNDLTFSNLISETFRDEFNARAFNNNDGTLNFSTNWLEIGEFDGATNGDVLVLNDQSNYNLRIKDNDNGGEGVQRQADLSAFTAATLSFDYRRSGLDDVNDYVAAWASGDGGASWAELDRFTGPSNDGSYQSTSYDLTPYIAANTRIRLLGSANLGNWDVVYFDNIQIQASTPIVCVGIDHFDIDHDGAGINCLAEPITITAEDAAGSTVTNYTGTITLDTQTTKGTWTLLTGNGVFTDTTTNDGLAIYAYDATDLGVATFNLTYLVGASPLNIAVTEGTISDDDLEGSLTFSPSGFNVTASALSNPPPNPINDPIATQTAGTVFAIHIAAYGQTPTDPTCGIIEAYDGIKNIKFWSTYDDPGSGTIQVTINANPIATSEAASAAQQMTFISGQTSASAKYKDVGQIQISLKDDTVAEPLPPTGIAGASNLFVVKPANFVLSNIIRTSDSFANPGAADETGLVFITAGNDFTITVSVNDSEGDSTSNFGQESAPENVLLVPTLVAPAAGVTPAIQLSTGFDFSAANGTATGTDFSWPEVGIIILTPHVGDNDYLGTGDVTGTVTGNIGRFIPDHFITSITNNGTFLNSSGGFTYIGQPFTYNVLPLITITAQNAGNATTQNYRDNFRLLTGGDVSLTYPANDSSTTGNDLLTPMALTATPATHSLSVSNPISFTFGSDSFSYTRTLPYDTDNALIRPFTSAINILLTAVSDSDGVSANDLATPRTISPTAIGLRYGRGVATNSFGPETLPITLNIAAEFYDATGNWVINSIDNSTSVPYVKTENAAEFTVTESLASPLAITSGQAAITLTPVTDPDAAINPGGIITIDYNFPAWLEPDQQATATFGIYRGNDRIINWREIIQ